MIKPIFFYKFQKRADIDKESLYGRKSKVTPRAFFKHTYTCSGIGEIVPVEVLAEEVGAHSNKVIKDIVKSSKREKE